MRPLTSWASSMPSKKIIESLEMFVFVETVLNLKETPDHNTLRDISDRQGAEWESCATTLLQTTMLMPLQMLQSLIELFVQQNLLL